MAAPPPPSVEQFLRTHGGFEDVSELWMRFAGPVPLPFAYRRGVFVPGKTLYENFVRISTLRETGGGEPLSSERRTELRAEWRRLPAIQREAYNPCFRRWAALEEGAGREPSLLRWTAEREGFLAAHASDPLCLDLSRRRRPAPPSAATTVRRRSEFLRAAAGPISRIVRLSKNGRTRFGLQNSVWRRALELADGPADDDGGRCFEREFGECPGLEAHHRRALAEALTEAQQEARQGRQPAEEPATEPAAEPAADEPSAPQCADDDCADDDCAAHDCAHDCAEEGTKTVATAVSCAGTTATASRVFIV